MSEYQNGRGRVVADARAGLLARPRLGGAREEYPAHVYVIVHRATVERWGQLAAVGAAVLGAAVGVVVLLLLARWFPLNVITAAWPFIFISVGAGMAARRTVEGRLRAADESNFSAHEESQLRRNEALYAARLDAIGKLAAQQRENGVDPRRIADRVEQETTWAYRSYVESLAAIYSLPVSPVSPLAAAQAPPASAIAAIPPSVHVTAMPVATSTVTLPVPLVTAKQQGRLIPFVGAGLSLSPDVEGGFPGWRDLPGRLLAECDRLLAWQDADDRDSMRGRFLVPDPAVPGAMKPRPMPLRELLLHLELLKHKLGVDYGSAISAIFRPDGAAPGVAHRAVMALGTRTVLTTNYDELLEAVDGPPHRHVYVGRNAADALGEIKAQRPVLFKVHGTANDWTSVVLTLGEYTAAHQLDAYRLVLNHLLIENTFLFVGYGMSDPEDLDLILQDNAEQLQGAASLHFALLQRLQDPQAEVDRKELLRKKYRVVVIPYETHADVVPLLQLLAAP